MTGDEADSAVLDIEAERQIILEVLLHTLADPGMAEGPADTNLLARVCHGLVHGSLFVSWCGYCVRTEEGYFDSRCLAGTMRKRLRIPKGPTDPVWRATEEKAVVVWGLANDPPLAWVAGLGADAREIACFPFGQPGLELVGIIGVRRTGYFERIGLTYFLTFSHVGRLALHLRDQALRDALTNLPNRRLFLERLTQARNKCRRDGRFVGIAILDFDGFKEVNDRFGHMAGDDVLCQAALRVRRALYTGDTLARLGGDEFGLLLGDIHARGVDKVCEQILAELREPFLIINGATAILSASIGITCYPSDMSSPATLLRHADAALYEAKRQGRDQYQAHTIALGTRQRHYGVAHDHMAGALSDGRLSFHYQPLVRLTHPERPVFGVEALLRWRDNEGRLRSASDLGDSLDHPRFARDIGRLALERSLSQAASWQTQGLRLRVSINISPFHLLDRRFCADVDDALARHPDVSPRHLELEVTESAPLQDFERARAALEYCARLGIRIGLDDFGTGHASLSYLQRFPAQTIKIDRSFLKDIVANPRDLAIIGGIIATARALGLDVVAEGVEHPEQAQLLKDVGCERMQGYWVTGPMPPEDIPGWVACYHLPMALFGGRGRGNRATPAGARAVGAGAGAIHPTDGVVGFLAEDFS
ncbi:EAL domain-containing protein [Acidiferrobacter sp.]|uniref:putative bifunctional diguanylate cyclase/phosphodiesterase n=1 Tax=Acidiferrobacter sp. TaxID=1872107 RepID=UPI002609D012|nr:EAL domain-containing protein [Acidiferrobacter sp.]